MSFTKRPIATAVGVVIGLVGAYLLPRWLGLHVIWMVAVSWVVCVVLHELGHFAAGMLVGFRPVFLMVGPFQMVRTPSRWELRATRTWFTGGLAGSVPRTFENLERRAVVMLWGGVANLLTCPPALVLADWWYPSHRLLFAVFFVLGLLSFFCAFVSPYPSRSGNFVSDGARIQMLTENGPEARRWAAALVLASSSVAGVRPRDYDPELLAHLDEPSDTSVDEYSARLILWSAASSRGEQQVARRHLLRALAIRDQAPEIMRPAVHAAAAIVASWVDRDASIAEQHLQAARSGLHPRIGQWVAEATVCAVKGDVERMRECIRAGRAECERSYDRGAATESRDWLDMLAAQAN